MTPKAKQILISVVASTLGLLAVAWGLNRYYYSWTGLLLSKVGLCDYKSVSVLGDNGYPVPVSFRLAPQNIAGEMKKKPNYQVNNRFNGYGAAISRDFDGVVYTLLLQYNDGSSSFDLSTALGTGKDFPGEKCTVPSSLLRENVFEMIDDLPITADQKLELRGKVWAVPTIIGKSFI